MTSNEAAVRPITLCGRGTSWRFRQTRIGQALSPVHTFHVVNQLCVAGARAASAWAALVLLLGALGLGPKAELSNGTEPQHRSAPSSAARSQKHRNGNSGSYRSADRSERRSTSG